MATFSLDALIPSFDDLKKTTPIGVSVLGTPVFDDITFPAGTYIDNQGNSVDYPAFSLTAVKTVVSQTKKIIKTQIAGRDGTAKEYISLGDFEIRINAKITEAFEVFPADQLNAFKQIYKIQQNIPIISKFVNTYFDVYNVVINDFTLEQDPGTINEVNLNMLLLSDDDIDLNEFVIND